MERLKQRFHSSTLAVKQRGRGAMTLHECLQAVGLQHHYASFTSMGVCRAAHLSALTMEDYPLLGIHTMEDRTRLFHLVQMVKKMVMCEDDDDYDDEGCAVVSSRYSYSRDPGEDICVGDDSSANVNNITADGFARASSVRRRLDFSCETSDLHQRLRTSPKGPVHKYTSHNRGKNPLYTSHTRLSHQCESLHKQTPRLATKTFNNIPAGPKHRKRISRPCEERGRSGASRHIVKPTPVYESARPAGYNYGLPQSSPAVIKRQAGDQRISVCVRKRPLMHAESRREADVVTTPGGDCVIIHESKEAVDLTQYILQHRFYFDQVFGEGSSNEDVYRRTAYPLVQHMLSGGKATCFAYGQTGAGKTHTMLGSSPTSPGLYALAVRDIFAHLSTAHTLSPILVYVSFFEIYCGQLYDLLDHRKRVFAREDGQRVVHIAGLREVRVDSVSSLLEVISHGLGERTQGMSGVNPLSSRSHALLQIQLRNKKQQIAGRMWFVDLAGSERASDTKEPDRQSRMEGAEINQSLLALKECIRSLNQEQSHTPFRQSKLTQVLKDSFVGNSMTCMIANISPGHLATEHTLNTLRYADRVKELKRQGEVRGGRRAKTVPCPRLNSSNSSSSTVVTRGKSPPKKAKLWQKETPGTISRTAGSPIGEAILCSTPKTSRWGEETSQQGSKGVGFEHITPVRGWVGTADRRERVKTLDKQGVREIEHERTDSHVVRCRAEPVLGQPCREGHLSTAQRERVFSQRETVKVGREEKRKLIEPQKQTDISTGREAERQNDKVLKNADKKNNEKQRHLRWYHQQLQQFIPSPASLSSPSFSSSNETSLSSTVSPTSCSFQPSRLSLSALMCHGLEEVLEKYRNQPETSLHVTNDNEDARGDFGSVGEDWTLLWEETKAKVEQHMDESEKSRPVKARSEVRAKQENKGTAGIVGRERRWAWVATGTQHADRMTGAVLNTVEAQASYNCVSEDRSGADEEGLSASHVPAEQGGSSSVSAHRNSLVNTFPLESPHLRAPAERPFSPGCEHAKTHPVPNKLSDVCFELKHTGCTSSIRHREKDQGVTTNVNRRHFPNAQSSTQLLNTSIAQTQCQKTARPLFHVKLKTVLPQDKTCGHSLSYTVDPLSIPWLQVDQAVGTVSCLQGEQNNASVCLQKNNRGEDNPRKVGNPICLDMLGTIVENELRQSRIQWALTSDTALNYNERRQAMCCATYENCETGSEERQTPEALLISLQDQGSPQKPPDQVTEVPAPTLSSFAFASMQASVKQRIKASAQYTRNTDSSNSHSLTHNMSSIKTQLPESGHLNVVSSQSDTAHSLRIRDSDNLLKMNSPTESNGQESICSQQVRPTNQRSTLENVNHTQWCVVRAHWEQLEEMEALCHTEGMLLCQQPDMDFNEYIHKLEKIMERKAQCVHSMRSQLQPYLTPNHSSQSHDEGEYNTNINSVI